MDAAGSAYVTGGTNSDESTFPVRGGPDLTYNGDGDAFVAKVNAAGTALVYAGYIGGAGGEAATASRWTPRAAPMSPAEPTPIESTFPVLGGPDLTYNGGRRLRGEGQRRRHSPGLRRLHRRRGTTTWARGIAVDGAGNAYVTGKTSSDESTFPEAGGPDLTYNGGYDAFVAKVGLGSTPPTDADAGGFANADGDANADGYARRSQAPGGKPWAAG